MGTTNSQIEINLPDIVGSGYASFWHDKHRYRILKGGRGSKKSRTSGSWYIYNIMKYPLANALVVRKTFNTNKDSTFAVLKWAARRLGVYHLWHFTTNPLEATYKPTGQKILFRGFDDPLKLTSIDVEVGVLCWVWIEEAFEIEDEADFDTLDETIRGEMPEGSNLWKQLTLTYNPWVCTHWTKTRFWDNEDPNAFRLTTTYKCNEWLDDADKKKIDDLQYTNPERYKVVGLGDYGLPGGAYFEEFRSDIHIIDPFEIPKWWKKFCGMDYGYDMLAVAFFAGDEKGNLFIYKEIYESELTLSKAAKKVLAVIEKDETIDYIVASPDLWKSEGQQRTGKPTGKHEVEYMREEGLEGLRRADNDRIPGWRNLREYLTVFDAVDNFGNPFKTAKLKIFKPCLNAIRTLPAIVKDEFKPEDVSNEPHELTHMPECLIGDTLILTANGEKPIKDIQIGDRVLTRKGFKKVLDSRITGTNEAVFKVVFSNDTYIIGTGNHPIWIKGNGFVSIDAIRYYDIIEVANNKGATAIWEKMLSFLTVKSIFAIPSQNMHPTEDIINVAKNICIMRFGNLLTEIFRRVMKFTIRTITPLVKKITWLKIWNVKRNINTCTFMAKRVIKAIQKRLWIKSDTLQRHGTAQKKGASFLKRMGKQSGKMPVLKIWFVNAAVKFLQLKCFTKKQDSVQTIVNPKTDAKTERMTKNAFVLFAEKTLRLINILKLKLVHLNAVHVVGIYPVGTAVVYNLSVKDEPEFYANGVLVHNSIRYGCMSRPILSKKTQSELDRLAERYKVQGGKLSAEYQLMREMVDEEDREELTERDLGL